jgi:hypothetical protein
MNVYAGTLDKSMQQAINSMEKLDFIGSLAQRNRK